MSAQFSLLTPPPSYSRPRLRLLPLREQPTYRVAHNPDACNLAELLAAIIGGQQQIELAEALLTRFDGLCALAQAHVGELAGVQGISQQTAVRLKAALALGKRLLSPVEEQPLIHSMKDAANILLPVLSHREQEYLVVIVLNTRQHVLDVVEVYHGSLNTAQIRAAEVFKPAIQRNAAAIIIGHNHPSGDPTPSPDDVAVTRALVEAGKLLDIELLDHLICGAGGRFTSLKERGLGFS